MYKYFVPDDLEPDSDSRRIRFVCDKVHGIMVGSLVLLFSFYFYSTDLLLHSSNLVLVVAYIIS